MNARAAQGRLPGGGSAFQCADAVGLIHTRAGAGDQAHGAHLRLVFLCPYSDMKSGALCAKNSPEVRGIFIRASSMVRLPFSSRHLQDEERRDTIEAIR